MAPQTALIAILAGLYLLQKEEGPPIARPAPAPRPVLGPGAVSPYPYFTVGPKPPARLPTTLAPTQKPDLGAALKTAGVTAAKGLAAAGIKKVALPVVTGLAKKGVVVAAGKLGAAGLAPTLTTVAGLALPAFALGAGVRGIVSHFKSHKARKKRRHREARHWATVMQTWSKPEALQAAKDWETRGGVWKAGAHYQGFGVWTTPGLPSYDPEVEQAWNQASRRRAETKTIAEALKVAGPLYKGRLYQMSQEERASSRARYRAAMKLKRTPTIGLAREFLAKEKPPRERAGGPERG